MKKIFLVAGVIVAIFLLGNPSAQASQFSVDFGIDGRAVGQIIPIKIRFFPPPDTKAGELITFSIREYKNSRALMSRKVRLQQGNQITWLFLEPGQIELSSMPQLKGTFIPDLWIELETAQKKKFSRSFEVPDQLHFQNQSSELNNEVLELSHPGLSVPMSMVTNLDNSLNRQQVNTSIEMSKSLPEEMPDLMQILCHYRSILLYPAKPFRFTQSQATALKACIRYGTTAIVVGERAQFFADPVVKELAGSDADEEATLAEATMEKLSLDINQSRGSDPVALLLPPGKLLKPLLYLGTHPILSGRRFGFGWVYWLGIDPNREVFLKNPPLEAYRIIWVTRLIGTRPYILDFINLMGQNSQQALTSNGISVWPLLIWVTLFGIFNAWMLSRKLKNFGLIALLVVVELISAHFLLKMVQKGLTAEKTISINFSAEWGNFPALKFQRQVMPLADVSFFKRNEEELSLRIFGSSELEAFPRTFVAEDQTVEMALEHSGMTILKNSYLAPAIENKTPCYSKETSIFFDAENGWNTKPPEGLKNLSVCPPQKTDLPALSPSQVLPPTNRPESYLFMCQLFPQDNEVMFNSFFKNENLQSALITPITPITISRSKTIYICPDKGVTQDWNYQANFNQFTGPSIAPTSQMDVNLYIPGKNHWVMVAVKDPNEVGYFSAKGVLANKSLVKANQEGSIYHWPSGTLLPTSDPLSARPLKEFVHPLTKMVLLTPPNQTTNPNQTTGSVVNPSVRWQTLVWSPKP